MNKTATALVLLLGALLAPGCTINSTVVVPVAPALVSFSATTWALTGCATPTSPSETAVVGAAMIQLFGTYNNTSLYTPANAARVAAAIVADGCQ